MNEWPSHDSDGSLLKQSNDNNRKTTLDKIRFLRLRLRFLYLALRAKFTYIVSNTNREGRTKSHRPNGLPLFDCLRLRCHHGYFRLWLLITKNEVQPDTCVGPMRNQFSSGRREVLLLSISGQLQRKNTSVTCVFVLAICCAGQFWTSCFCFLHNHIFERN